MKLHFHKWFLTEPIDIWKRFRICTKCGIIQEEYHPPGSNILHTEFKNIGVASKFLLKEIEALQAIPPKPNKPIIFDSLHEIDDRY